jgi:hypothetical protein
MRYAHRTLHCSENKMKLNLGCGHNKFDGFVNVDMFASCNPDMVCDLETLPWPWQDNVAEEVRFIHSLEHLGQSTQVFLGMMQELYRICSPGAVIEIHVPHPRHDNFINDPTHVRPITPAMMTLFDRQLNDRWQANGDSNSPLAHYLNVDFVLTNTTIILDEPYASQYQQKLLSDGDVAHMSREWNNIVSEYRLSLNVRKP